MKRYVYVLLSCLLTVTASAQSTLEQKVAKAVKEAPERVSVTMERNLIQYYHDGEVEKVDMILMQQPLLANTHIVGENGQRIPMAYDAFLRDDLPMLKVFYKHGAECEQCLKKSFVSEPNDKQKLTLRHNLPIYGADYEDLVKIKSWYGVYYALPLAKEVRINQEEELKEFIRKVISHENTLTLLDSVRSDDPETQQKIEKYRAVLQSLHSQLANEQQVPSPLAFPQVSAEFLGKTYEPKTVKELDAAKKEIETDYQNEFRKKYLPDGQTTPSAELTSSRDSAIARLEKARPQLVKYEERMGQRSLIQDSNRIVSAKTDTRIAQVVKMLRGRVEMAPLFFEHFPEAEKAIWDWQCYPDGVDLMDVNFKIPVLYNKKKMTVYDGRPATFGTVLLDKAIPPYIKNHKEAKEAVAMFAGGFSGAPYWIDAWERCSPNEVKSIFFNPREPDRLYFVLYADCHYYYEDRYSDGELRDVIRVNYSSSVLATEQYGKRRWEILEKNSSATPLNDRLANKGYIRLYEQR